MWSEAEQFFSTELNLGAGAGKPQTVELFKRMSELIILTASRTLQGKEVRQALNSRFAQLFHDLDGGFIPINFMFTNVPLPANVRRDRAQKEMSDFYKSIIEQRRTGEAMTDEHDMISALTGCTYKNGVPLTDTDIAHMMIAILMAGQHTSSATSSWTLLHIADRQDIQEALWDEQKKVLGQPDGTLREPTYEDTKDMPLMDSCIRETLRMVCIFPLQQFVYCAYE
jgi:sterol 14-demethylase